VAENLFVSDLDMELADEEVIPSDRLATEKRDRNVRRTIEDMQEERRLRRLLGDYDFEEESKAI